MAKRLMTLVAFAATFVVATATAPLHAQQDPGAPEAPAGAAAAAEGLKRGFGSLFGAVKDKVTGTNSDKPAIESLKPEPYRKSNESIGEERDLFEKRIAYGLVYLPSFSAYANEVLDKLKVASGVTEIPGKVLIAANDQLDAGSSADGNITVSLGYIRSLKSEDEFAALLAHELAHVLLRHHDSNFVGRTQKQLALLLNSAMVVRNAFDKATGNAVSASLSASQRKTVGKMELMIKLNDRALHPAWKRGQEYEADRLGMDLVIKAGYSYTGGMLPWLEMVGSWEAEQDLKRAEMLTQKQTAIESLAGSGNIDATIKQGMELAFNDIVDQFSATHDGGDKRREEIDAYYVRVYQEKVPRPEVNAERYRRAVSRPEVRGVLESYSQLFAARNLIVEQKPEEAWTILRRVAAPGSPVADHALANHLAFQALRRMGRMREAEPFLRRSAQAPEPAWEPIESAADYYRDQSRSAEVLKTGQTAFAQFSKAPSSYSRLIAMYKRSGLTDAAQTMMNACVLQEAERRDECIKTFKAP